MAENEAHDSRRREDAAIRLEQRFEDFLEANRIKEEATTKADGIKEIESKRWRESVDARLDPLTDIYKTLQAPAKMARVIALLMLTPAAGMLGWTFIKRSIIWVSHALATPR